MFRKILSLLLLLLAGFSGSAQKIETDHTCFDIEIDLDYERERDEDCLPIKDQYVVCRDQTIFIPPIVDAELRRTDTYGVSRSEEHTSELQSRPHLVCRLLLEKKKEMI